MEAGIITCEYVTDDRVYIIQNHFAGTKRLSEVLESMIELSLNRKAANQNDSPKGKTIMLFGGLAEDELLNLMGR